MEKKKIFVAGGHGMVGSAIVRALQRKGCQNLLVPKRSELDFTDQAKVRSYFEKHLPEIVIISAAKVGGILANHSYPAEFLYDNLIIECNLIHEAHRAGVQRLLFLGSTCIYPKFAPQPMSEEVLLTGPLEPTNEAYALAKIAGVKLCYFYTLQYKRSYIAAMPTNLYGPGDNYHSNHAHVIPALIRRFHEAKAEGKEEVIIWGSGRALREFLYVDDLAEATLCLLEKYEGPLHINVGSPDEVSIYELAKSVAEAVGFKGRIERDLTKPDGTPRKKTDLTRILSLGWRPKISLKEGLEKAYNDFLSHQESLREK